MTLSLPVTRQSRLPQRKPPPAAAFFSPFIFPGENSANSGLLSHKHRTRFKNRFPKISNKVSIASHAHPCTHLHIPLHTAAMNLIGEPSHLKHRRAAPSTDSHNTDFDGHPSTDVSTMSNVTAGLLSWSPAQPLTATGAAALCGGGSMSLRALPTVPSHRASHAPASSPKTPRNSTVTSPRHHSTKPQVPGLGLAPRPRAPRSTGRSEPPPGTARATAARF